MQFDAFFPLGGAQVRFHLVAQGILRPQNISPALIVNITTFLWDSGLSEAKPRKGEALQWHGAPAPVRGRVIIDSRLHTQTVSPAR